MKNKFVFKVKFFIGCIGMFTFHYLICKKPIKDENYGSSQYKVKKLIFENNQLSSSDDLCVNEDKLTALKSDILENQFTEIDDSKIDLDSFLKNIELSKVN
tara:strand:- start:10183 stop:10485 length:303 start_codon:yes stop_codon:yes gene_type:complete